MLTQHFIFTMDQFLPRNSSYSCNSKVVLPMANKRFLLALGMAALITVTQGVNLRSYAQNSTPASQEWGIVLGADRSQKEADIEVANNTRVLGIKPRTYMCNGWVRKVAVFKNRQDALKALRKARVAGSPYSPYIVSLWQWCPGKRLLR